MNRIALVGGRGTGKSTVGPIVAADLGFQFLDADRELEAAAGRTIIEIFRTDGEGAFRVQETAVLARLLDLDNVVIACGGGAVLDPLNRERLNGRAFTVWLEASPGTCWRRMCGDSEPRPDLTPHGGEREVREVQAARRPLYQAAAHAVIDAEPSPQEVADAILQAWRSRQVAE